MFNSSKISADQERHYVACGGSADPETHPVARGCSANQERHSVASGGSADPETHPVAS